MLRRSLVLVAALAAALAARRGARVVAHRQPPRSRSRSTPPTATSSIKQAPDAHRLALADGDRGSLRGRRRQAGRRGRRPVGLPEAARRGRSSPASRRTSRRSPAYNPDLVIVSNDGGLVGALEKLGITVLLEPARRHDRRRRTTQIRQLGARDRPRARRRRRVVRGDAGAADRADPQRAEEAAASDASTTSSTPTTTRRPRRRSSAASTGCSASRTSPTPPTRRTPATRSSRPSTSSRRTRRLVVLADSVCCGQTRGDASRRGPGWSRIAAVHERPRRRGRRQRRVALGAAHRRLRARGRRGREALVAWSSTRHAPARAPGSARAASRGRGALCAARVPRRRARSSGSASGRSAIGAGRDRRVGAVARPVPARALAALDACRRRSSGSCARRASCSPRSSAGCSRSPARPYQGVFRNPLADPYLLGVAAGAGLGATLAIAYGAGTARAARPAGGVRRRRASRSRSRTCSAARRRARARPARSSSPA